PLVHRGGRPRRRRARCRARLRPLAAPLRQPARHRRQHGADQRQRRHHRGRLPKGFAFFEPSALWMPMRFSDADRTAQGRYLRVVARLKPGVSWQQADLEMKAIARRRAVDVPELDANWTALASPMRDDLVGNSRTPLLVLL